MFFRSKTLLLLEFIIPYFQFPKENHTEKSITIPNVILADFGSRYLSSRISQSKDTVQSVEKVVGSTMPLDGALTVNLSVVKLTIPLARALTRLASATTLLAGTKISWKY